MAKLKCFSTRKWRKQFILKFISVLVLLFLVENSHKRSDFPRNWGTFAILFGPIEFLASSIATLGQTIRCFNSERRISFRELEEISAERDHPQVPHRHL